MRGTAQPGSLIDTVPPYPLHSAARPSPRGKKGSWCTGLPQKGPLVWHAPLSAGRGPDGQV